MLRVCWIIGYVAELLVFVISLPSKAAEVCLVLWEEMSTVILGIAYAMFAIAVIQVFIAMLAHVLAVGLSKWISAIFEALVLSMIESSELRIKSTFGPEIWIVVVVNTELGSILTLKDTQINHALVKFFSSVVHVITPSLFNQVARSCVRVYLAVNSINYF